MSGNAKNDKRVKNGGRTVFAEESMGEWKGITATQKKNTKIKEWVQNGGRTVFYRVVIAF